MMEYLISAGSEINKRFSTKSSQTTETALTIAIGAQRFAKAIILLNRGAKVDMDPSPFRTVQPAVQS